MPLPPLLPASPPLPIPLLDPAKPQKLAPWARPHALAQPGAAPHEVTPCAAAPKAAAPPPAVPAALPEVASAALQALVQGAPHPTCDASLPEGAVRLAPFVRTPSPAPTAETSPPPMTEVQPGVSVSMPRRTVTLCSSSLVPGGESELSSGMRRYSRPTSSCGGGGVHRNQIGPLGWTATSAIASAGRVTSICGCLHAISHAELERAIPALRFGSAHALPRLSPFPPLLVAQRDVPDLLQLHQEWANEAALVHVRHARRKSRNRPNERQIEVQNINQPIWIGGHGGTLALGRVARKPLCGRPHPSQGGRCSGTTKCRGESRF